MGLIDDAGLTIYKIAKEAGTFKVLLSFFRKKKKILLLGASGAGKSQFFDSIDDALSARLTSTNRTISVQKRKVVIEGIPFLIFDTPGQIFDEAIRKSAINEAMRTGYEGFINIVSYGYHEATEADKSEIFTHINNELIVNQQFLKDRREVELNLLSEWIPKIDTKTVKWVLTVVTKADLWWPDKNEIMTYYQKGEYNQLIKDAHIPHHIISYCSVIEPFFNTKTSGKFGDSDRKELRKHLLESIVSLTGTERK